MIYENKIHLRYIVTGTGRCGTVYMARLLTSLNIPCSHEAIFDYHGLEEAKQRLLRKSNFKNSLCSSYDILNELDIDPWLNLDFIQAESSYMSAPFLQDDIFKNTKIIHVVRNPLKVISSHILDINFFEYDEKHNLWLFFVEKHLPELKSIKNTIEKACYFYVQWNKMIETNCQNKQYFFHKIENKCNQSLCNFLEQEFTDNYFNNSSINSWKKRSKDLTLNDVPNGQIKKDFEEIIEKYRYNQFSNFIL